MSRYASLSSPSSRVRGLLQARLYYAREKNREARKTDRQNARGPELIENGTFDTDLTGWTTGVNLTSQFDAGTAEITRAGAIEPWAAFHQVVSTVIGGVYEVRFTTSGPAVGAAMISDDPDSYSPVTDWDPAEYPTGDHVKDFIATTETSVFSFWPSNDATVSNIDSVSIKRKFV